VEVLACCPKGMIVVGGPSRKVASTRGDCASKPAMMVGICYRRDRKSSCFRSGQKLGHFPKEFSLLSALSLGVPS